MHRHGSRYPLVSELGFVTDLVAKLGNSSAAIQKAHLPENLQFLKDGYTSTLGHDDLTAPGRLQLFEHGVECVTMLCRVTRCWFADVLLVPCSFLSPAACPVVVINAFATVLLGHPRCERPAASA